MSQREPISISSRWPFERQPEKKEASLKATALKTTLSGALALALIGGATLASTPASAEPGKNAVYRGDGSGAVPSSYYQEVRRRVFVAPAYAYDPYYDGPAYFGPSIAYVPPVEYAPPVAAYDYGPPVDYGYYGPGPGVAFAAPGVGLAVGY
jgi:hypothetical protein